MDRIPVGAIFCVITNSVFELRWKAASCHGTYVLPDYRRLGIATALRKAAVAQLRDHGVKKMFGAINTQNIPSIESAKSIGLKTYAQVVCLDL